MPDSPPAGWKNRSNSFDFPAKPENQTKTIVISLLPQAKKGSRGATASY
jgi:hypothetical protein